MTVLLLALSTAASTPGDDGSGTQVSRGLYLAGVGDDAACHTAPGGKPFAGAFARRRDVSVGAGVTAEAATGVGARNEQGPRQAMSDRVGEDLDGAVSLATCANVTKPDAAALWDYNQAVEPVSRPVASNPLWLPFN